MTSMNVVDSRLNWFLDRMREKLALPKNQAKSDWRLMTVVELLERIKQEVSELNRAVKSRSVTPDFDVYVEKVVSECCDVANFAFMLADRVNS